MILKALYDYYQRSQDQLPLFGMERKEIAFLIVIDREGNFVRIDNLINEDGNGTQYIVSKSWARTGTTPQPFHFWDNLPYTCAISSANIKIEKTEKGNDLDKLNKEIAKNKKNFQSFIDYVNRMKDLHPEDIDINAVAFFYEKHKTRLEQLLKESPQWDDIKRNINKNISFLIDGDSEIIAAKTRIIGYTIKDNDSTGTSICLVTGERCNPIPTFTKIKLGKFSDTKLMSFQKGSGYDSYGKEQGSNAPISEDAEFKCSTALKKMLEYGSGNKFNVGNRTFVFWSSKITNESQLLEQSIFNMFGYTQEDDPNMNIEKVRKTFESIYNGNKTLNDEGWFYILGLYPANKARIAISYWAEIPLKEFAGTICRHFDDMSIIDTRKETKPYMTLRDILSAVTLGGKSSEATPNLPDALVKSIFQGLPYPQTLFASCIRRIRAESGDKDRNPISISRAAILKAYLNRLNNNHKKIQPMLDYNNENQGYLCGRLFAVLEKIQEEANNQHSIRERYMNSASTTPAAVFSTILNLSNHHSEKLNSEGRKIFFEKLKQEIMNKIDADGFRAQLDLQDQGRFFIGYYHQRQSFFDKKEENNNEQQ